MLPSHDDFSSFSLTICLCRCSGVGSRRTVAAIVPFPGDVAFLRDGQEVCVARKLVLSTQVLGDLDLHGADGIELASERLVIASGGIAHDVDPGSVH